MPIIVLTVVTAQQQMSHGMEQMQMVTVQICLNLKIHVLMITAQMEHTGMVAVAMIVLTA